MTNVLSDCLLCACSPFQSAPARRGAETAHKGLHVSSACLSGLGPRFPEEAGLPYLLVNIFHGRGTRRAIGPTSAEWAST